jgi:hypothetical protein
MNVSGTARYKGKQIAVQLPESLAKNTLDATHKSRIKHFKDEKKNLGAKKADLAEMQKKLQTMLLVDVRERDFIGVTMLEDKIKQLKTDVEYIESGKAELEYFTKVGELLIEYYDNVGTKPKQTATATSAVAATASIAAAATTATTATSSEAPIHKKKKIAPSGKSVYDLFMQPSTSETVQSFITERKDGVRPVSETKVEQKVESNVESKIESNVESNVESKIEPKVESKIESEIIVRPKISGKLTGFVEKQEGFKRADFFHEYLNKIDPHYVPEDEGTDNREEFFCEQCNCYRQINHTDATMVCPGCASYVDILIDSDKPNYKDPPAEISNFPYRRINHFNECLSQFQAKESTEIPQIVYDTIIMEMKKERITDMALLTREKVRRYLGKQANKKFTNYYEHIPHIINRLSGIQPKTMSPKMEEELRRDFHKIQEPYAKHKPKNRKNFLNYNYVLHKLCQIRGLHDQEYISFLGCFPLLKSKEKLYQQDIVWKKICSDLDWKFIPSV